MKPKVAQEHQQKKRKGGKNNSNICNVDMENLPQPGTKNVTNTHEPVAGHVFPA